MTNVAFLFSAALLHSPRNSFQERFPGLGSSGQNFPITTDKLGLEPFAQGSPGSLYPTSGEQLAVRPKLDEVKCIFFFA